MEKTGGKTPIKNGLKTEKAHLRGFKNEETEEISLKGVSEMSKPNIIFYEFIFKLNIHINKNRLVNFTV